MRNLVLRGFIDVRNLLLILIAGLAGLMFIYVVTDQIVIFFTLVLSVKIAYYIWAVSIACLVQFVASVVRNYKRAEYVSRTEEGYTFDHAAQIIGRYPDAFENYGFGQQ